MCARSACVYGSPRTIAMDGCSTFDCGDGGSAVDGRVTTMPDHRAEVDVSICCALSVPMHVMGREESRSCGACLMPLWWHDEWMMRACRRRFLFDA